MQLSTCCDWGTSVLDCPSGQRAWASAKNVCTWLPEWQILLQRSKHISRTADSPWPYRCHILSLKQEGGIQPAERQAVDASHTLIRWGCSQSQIPALSFMSSAPSARCVRRPDLKKLRLQKRTKTKLEKMILTYLPTYLPTHTCMSLHGMHACIHWHIHNTLIARTYHCIAQQIRPSRHTLKMHHDVLHYITIDCIKCHCIAFTVPQTA